MAQQHLDIPSGLIHMFFEKLQRMLEGQDIVFPIKKIKGLNVHVILRKRAADWYELIIEPTDIALKNNTVFACYWKQEDYSEGVNENEFSRDTAKSILIVLKTIKIDKLNGVFITQKMIDEKQTVEEDDNLWSHFCYEYELDKNLVLDFYDCEMCFKSTKTKIDCGHHLCLKCLINLNEKEETTLPRRCPLCHHYITSLL
jgi:hypothetical protein